MYTPCIKGSNNKSLSGVILYGFPSRLTINLGQLGLLCDSIDLESTYLVEIIYLIEEPDELEPSKALNHNISAILDLEDNLHLTVLREYHLFNVRDFEDVSYPMQLSRL